MEQLASTYSTTFFWDEWGRKINWPQKEPSFRFWHIEHRTDPKLCMEEAYLPHARMPDLSKRDEEPFEEDPNYLDQPTERPLAFLNMEEGGQHLEWQRRDRYYGKVRPVVLRVMKEIKEQYDDLLRETTDQEKRREIMKKCDILRKEIWNAIIV